MDKISGGYTIWAKQTIESKIFFYKPAMWFKIWFYIVSSVCWSNTKLFKRGELLITYEDIMKATKASKQQTKDCVHFLEMEHMIESRKTTRGMIRIVLNYEYFQNIKNYKTTERTQDRPLGDHLETPPIKKEDKEKNTITIESECKKYLDTYNQVFNKNLRSYVSFESNLKFWLKIYSIDEICLAVTKIKKDPYWGDKDISVEWLLRQADSKGKVDYIGRMLNSQSKKGNISEQMMEAYGL